MFLKILLCVKWQLCAFLAETVLLEIVQFTI